MAQPNAHTHPEFDVGFQAGVESVQWEARPGEMHPVDQAFHDLAIKERNYERVKVDRLEASIAQAREALEVDSDWPADRLLDAIGHAIEAMVDA